MIRNRSELVFMYDIKNANPNGDPDENRPRIDEETGRNIVTDVRLKRTIRDYIEKYKNKNVWVTVESKEGTADRKTREEKLDELWEKFGIKSREEGMKKLLEEFIDLRLFGATIAGKKESKKGEKVFTWIGPVQFKFGKSLHAVEPTLIRGTSILPTQEQKAAGGAFTEMWILPYSLICFYGIINENTAKDTGLTEDDVKLLLEGMWNGTKNLITRSKVGQVPRFLLRVVYKENNYHIGDLDQKIKLLDCEGKKIRNISEVKVDITELLKTLKLYKNKIKKIEYEVSEDINFVVNDLKIKEIEDKLKEIVGERNVEKLGFESSKTE